MRRGNRPGSWQPPDPARHGESMAPAAQERTAPDPQPGGSYDTGNGLQVVSSCSRVQRWCRRPSSEQVSYRSFPHECENSLTPLFLLSKSNPLRWASIWFGTDDRGHPHTASVLTWLKIKERQTFAGRSLHAPKRLSSKGFRLRQTAVPFAIYLEIRRKQTDLPRGGLRPSERPMIKRRAFHIWQNRSKT